MFSLNLLLIVMNAIALGAGIESGSFPAVAWLNVVAIIALLLVLPMTIED